jgi:hypothetical protein
MAPTQLDGRDHISALPPELLVNVFLSLTIREALRHRRVSKTFRAIVDANVASLARKKTAFHQQRLSDDHKKLTDIQATTLEDSLRLYLDHYGLAQVDRYGRLYRIVDIYVLANFNRHTGTVTQTLERAAEWVLGMAAIERGEKAS